MATLAFAADSKGDYGNHKAAFPGGRSAAASIGGFKAVFGKFTFDTNYPDGGYTAATLEGLDGLALYIDTIFAIIPLGGAVGSNVYIPIGWDGTNRKLMAGTDSGVELTTGDNALDGTIADCLVLGR